MGERLKKQSRRFAEYAAISTATCMGMLPDLLLLDPIRSRCGIHAA